MTMVDSADRATLERITKQSSPNRHSDLAM